LTDEGAKVYRLKTESEVFVTDQRASHARQYNPDLFISIHCNWATSSNARGPEAYYFTPFSQPLARYVSASIANYASLYVHGAGSLDRGAKYNYFFVTQQQDFPSILIETGFVSNYTEAMALANSSHQPGFAKAIVTGIKNYMAQTTYSCYGDGAAIIEGNPEAPPPPASPETVPMTPSDVVATIPEENGAPVFWG
jgi:N-acetylmuramoyl-L-alanine amidase